MEEKTVTLVVHGTYAAEARWWRLGADGETTFADRLETELSRRGLQRSVWTPWLDEGLEVFAWSGRNRHRDRLAAARELSASLHRFASRVEATPDDPVTVHLVAHSHGGNVVLEALGRLRPTVRVGRVVLLGTPLVTVRPIFRLARFASLAILSAIFVLGLITLLGTLFGFDAPPSNEAGGLQIFSTVLVGGGLLLYILGCGVLFWMICKGLDVAWRAVCRLFEPLQWWRGKVSSLLYGPSPEKLAKILGAPPILLLTSYNDEASLLLQASSGPAKLYKEYAATFSRPGRVLEWVFLRSFMLGALVKGVEMFLEVFALGVPLWRSLFFDFGVVPLRENPYYPGRLLVQETLDVRPVAASMPGVVADEMETVPLALLAQPRGLHLSLQEVTAEIRHQVRLRHSAYYDNDEVIDRIARFLCGEDVETVERPEPAPSWKPPANFWETLLVANVAVTLVWMGIAEYWTPQEVLVVLVAGYAFPALAFALLLGLHGAVRRRLPAKPWRWFWGIWGLCSLVWLLRAPYW